MARAEKENAAREFYRATADLQYLLSVFGEDLAKRKKYKRLSGIDAVHFYLIEKYHWTPAVVKSFSYDDLHFLMTEEMADWTAPKSLMRD